MREAHGADFSIKDPENYNSLLHIASKIGNTEMVYLILATGIDINYQNKFGETALHYVCSKSKDINILQILITKGGNPDISNNLGDSPVSIAQRNGFHDAMIYFANRNVPQYRPRLPSNRPSSKLSRRSSRISN